MSYGDHWSEPARCSRCGQEKGTHDDGECVGVQRSMGAAAKVMAPAKPNWEAIADRLYELSVFCRNPLTLDDWRWVNQSIQGLDEMVALEIWTKERQSKKEA